MVFQKPLQFQEFKNLNLGTNHSIRSGHIMYRVRLSPLNFIFIILA